MKQRVELFGVQAGYRVIAAVWNLAKPLLAEGRRLYIVIQTETRSLKQNSLMWSCLTDLSEQVTWYGRKFTPEGWKDFITGHIEGQDLVPNMDGTGFVMLGRGRSTSDMTIAEMIEVIDRCHAFGALEGVQFRRTSLGRDVPDEVFGDPPPPRLERKKSPQPTEESVTA